MPRQKKPPRIKTEAKLATNDISAESDGRIAPPNGTAVQLEFKKRGGGKPGRKTMYELMECYREKLSALWNVACNHMVRLSVFLMVFEHIFRCAKKV